MRKAQKFMMTSTILFSMLEYIEKRASVALDDEWEEVINPPAVNSTINFIL